MVQQHVFKKITTHSLTNEVKSYNPRGGSRILGKGGSKYIHNWGRVRDSKGVWGSADSSPSGVRFFAFAFNFFSMKFTVKSNTYTSCVIRITRACMDSDEKTVHSSQCYDSYCSVIKFVTQSYCEFGVHVTMHAPATCRSKNDTCIVLL